MVFAILRYFLSSIGRTCRTPRRQAQSVNDCRLTSTNAINESTKIPVLLLSYFAKLSLSGLRLCIKAPLGPPACVVYPLLPFIRASPHRLVAFSHRVFNAPIWRPSIDFSVFSYSLPSGSCLQCTLLPLYPTPFLFCLPPSPLCYTIPASTHTRQPLG